MGADQGAQEIPRTVSRDLDLSGYFEVLNENAYIEEPGKCGGTTGVAYSDWTVIGAEGVVRGEVESAGGGMVKVRLYLHDVARQKVVLAKEYTGDESHVRQIAHRFANEIVRIFTGKDGMFGTQIVFSGRVGRLKELFVMDLDGSNLRQITDDRGLAVSPSWAPSGESVLYTSYRFRQPDLFIRPLANKTFKQITNDEGLEVGAKFSPDGSVIIVSRSVGRDSNLVLLNPDGSLRRKVTDSGGAIDVSPSWAPDGNSIAFCSNRAGGPQIYTMPIQGGTPRRISYVSSNYCTSPAWSPKGDKLAFVCMVEGRFQVFVTDPNGSKAVQLTSLGDNEGPSWAPNGEYLVFSSTFGRGRSYDLAIMRADGSSVKKITETQRDEMDPSWGPLPR